MRFVLGLVLASTATAAFAGDEVMAPYIGNTLSAAEPSGALTKVYYEADHTWSSVGPQGEMKGTWSIRNNNELCVKLTEPEAPPQVQPPCVKVEPHTVGESWLWTQPGATAPTTLRLTPGH